MRGRSRGADCSGKTVGVALAGMALPGCRQDQPTVEHEKTGKKKPSAHAVEQASAANNEIGVGIIGCGRRNGQLAIGKGGQGESAEVRPHHRRGRCQHAPRRARGPSTTSARPTRTTDRLLDRKDVDVVVYATPEHWHYLPCIHACQAGKDIYGEQPLSHTIREGRVMVEAVPQVQTRVPDRRTAAFASRTRARPWN